MKVLLVEDEKIIRNGLIKHIDAKKLEISEMRAAKNGNEAIDICENFSPDVIISDINMPGISGVELCQQLKKKFPDVQIIFLTGYVVKDYLKAAIDLHVVRYLEKPVSVDEVMDALREAFILVNRNRIISESISNAKPKATEDNRSNKEDADDVSNLVVKTAVDYIKENYKNADLSVKDVADTVYLTPTYFSSLFKKEMGMSFSCYLTETRLEEAKRLLMDPRYKLYEISDLVGYSDSNYFTKTFKKKTGLSPSQYRDGK